MIGRQSVVVVGNSLLGAAQGYVTLFVIARYMGDELLGARAFALSLVFLLGMVCRLGFPVTHARRLARGDDPATLNGAYLVLKVALTAAFLLLAATGGWVWFALLGRPVLDTTLPALWLGAAIVAVQSLRDLPVNTFRGLRLIREREAVLFTNTLVTMGATVVVAAAYAHSHGRWTPWPAAADALAQALGGAAPMGSDRALFLLMAGFFLGEVAAFILALGLFALRRIPIGAPQPDVLRDYLRASLPLMVLSLGAVLTKRVSEAMLGFWWDAAELGRYAAAAKLSELVLLVPAGITIVLLPAVSALDATGDRAAAARVVRDAERWISLLVWPVVVYVALHARDVLHILLSDDFLPAAGILVVMFLHSLVASLRMPLQTKALGLGEDRFAGRVALGAVAANVVLNVLLIPDHLLGVPLVGLGARGAAWAALGSAFVPLFAYRRKAHEWTGHPYFAPSLLVHAGAAAATYGLFRLVGAQGWLPPVLRFYDLLGSALMVLAAYLLLLVLLRELKASDLRDAWGLVHGPQTPK